MKALPVLAAASGLFAAVFAVLAFGVVAGGLLVLLAAATGVAAILQKERRAVVTGAVLVLLAVVALVLVVGNVTLRGGAGVETVEGATGMAAATAVAVIAAAAFVAVRPDAVDRRVRAVGIVGAAGATILAFVFAPGLGEYHQGANYMIALLALAAAAPGAWALRTGGQPRAHAEATP